MGREEATKIGFQTLYVSATIAVLFQPEILQKNGEIKFRKRCPYYQHNVVLEGSF